MNALGEPRSVLVLGGTSDIALALTRRLVERGTRRVVLAGRDLRALEEVATSIRAPQTAAVAFDADDTDSHGAFVSTAFDGDDVDLVVIAFGLLGHAKGLEATADEAVQLVRTNYLGAVSVGTHVVGELRRQGHGVLVVLSSVAGQRARRSNFVYGSTKAGLDAWAQGLGDALQGTGVRVLVVRPGFVRSKMTAGLPEVPLSSTPDDVAAAVVRALERDSEVAWVPRVLGLVMWVVRHMPRALFRRLRV